MRHRSKPRLLPVLWLLAACQSADADPQPSSDAAASSGTATAAQPAPADGRRYELERIDGTAVVQLYADGFAQLSRRDRLLAYHLCQAAIAGRDIFLDQRFVYALGIRWVLESMYQVRNQLPPEVAQEIERYTKLFWVHNGIHDNHSTQKRLLRLTWEQFELAARTAIDAGHRLGRVEIAPARDLRDVYAILTDPTTFRSVTDKNPEGDIDPLLASCNNLYVGVNSADLASFQEKNGLNSRLVKQVDGSLREEVYRCGDGKDVPPGRYAAELARVNEHLNRALPHAPPATRAALRHLMRFHQTGDLADWRAYNIAWVQDRDAEVDLILGFIEVYMDVRGIKGAWEAIVSFRDRDKTAAIEALAREASWFEQRMPWDDEWKKPDVRGISAKAIAVLIETGDSGPITPVGINLPNEQDIREQYGSKSVNLANVVLAYNMTQQQGSAAEFSASPAEAARAQAYAAAMDDLHTNLHEVIGHASGQVRKEVQNPAQMLGLYYSTLEEARADLVGLYWIADPKLRQMRLVPNDDAVLAKYEAYARNALVQLRRVPKGGKLEEDHMRNRQLIVHWLLANDGGVERIEQGGKTFYRVTSVDAFRQGCGRLLAEVMRIKATGDFPAGKALVETYGTKVDPALHQQVLDRVAALGLPSVTGFVQPELVPIRDGNGDIVDAEVVHCQDLADQMLRWSGRR